MAAKKYLPPVLQNCCFNIPNKHFRKKILQHNDDFWQKQLEKDRCSKYETIFQLKWWRYFKQSQRKIPAPCQVYTIASCKISISGIMKDFSNLDCKTLENLKYAQNFFTKQAMCHGFLKGTIETIMKNDSVPACERLSPRVVAVDCYCFTHWTWKIISNDLEHTLQN